MIKSIIRWWHLRQVKDDYFHMNVYKRKTETAEAVKYRNTAYGVKEVKTLSNRYIYAIVPIEFL